MCAGNEREREKAREKFFPAAQNIVGTTIRKSRKKTKSNFVASGAVRFK